VRTAHSLQSRLSIIHLVHEARGLDVNPQTIERFRVAGDSESVKVLEIIHHDEITVSFSVHTLDTLRRLTVLAWGE